MKLKYKYFWLLCLFLFSLISSLSYGFIKDLYFWNEDYKYINSFYTGELMKWPYQGDIFILRPFFLLFSDKPAGYFVSALVLYIFLSLIVAFFIYSFTRSRLLAILSGIIFSSGYVGSENMQMASTAIPHTLYLILALLTLILYMYSHAKSSVKYWLFSLIIYVFLINLITVRAHTLIVLLFLTEVYILLSLAIGKKQKKSYLFLFKSMAKRLSMFFISTIVVYSFLPGPNSSDKNAIISNFEFVSDKFSIQANMNFFSAMGSYLFPSGLFDLLSTNTDQNLVFTSIAGIFLLLVLLGIAFLSKRDKDFGKLLLFLILSWIASYWLYHWKEYNYLHPSWSRYLFFGYPFFAMIMALLIKRFFFQAKLHIVKFTGFFIVALIVSSNLIFGYASPVRKFRLERSFHLQNFIPDLKKHVPRLDGNTLFYFDTAYDPRISGMFNSFLACGFCSSKYPLAFFYHQNPEIVKIAQDYDEFVSEYKKGNYLDAYIFYYSKNRELIDLTTFVTSTNSSQNFLNIKNDKISYLSEVVDTKNGKKDTNIGLSIDTSSFPSHRPIKVDIDMKFDGFGNDKNIYPYPFETSIVSKLTSNANTMQSLLNYIIERNDFKKNVKIQTSKLLDKQYAGEASVDNNLETSWIANKQEFFNTGSAWITINFPSKQEISQIRWLSGYKYRLPIDYDYQISDSENGPWNTIFSVRNRKVQVQEYAVDKLQKVESSYLRMVIYKTSFDSPAIAEIEILKQPLNISSEEVDFFLDHPLAGVLNRNEAEKIMSVLRYYQKIKIYPLTDKFLDKNQVNSLYIPIELDGDSHHYVFTIPASGTNLDKIIIEFPRIPLSADINSVRLSSLPL